MRPRRAWSWTFITAFRSAATSAWSPGSQARKAAGAWRPPSSATLEVRSWRRAGRSSSRRRGTDSLALVAENLTRQILREHLAEGELSPGKPIALRVDQTLLQDATGTMAFMQYEQLGVPRTKVERAVQNIDHNVVQLAFRNPADDR